ncbi:transposase [Pseudomonas sp. SDS3-8]|nr:transposase [Pseudomonas sp. SDS3-8]
MAIAGQAAVHSRLGSYDSPCTGSGGQRPRRERLKDAIMAHGHFIQKRYQSSCAVQLRTGWEQSSCEAWLDMPERFGPWSTVYGRYSRRSSRAERPARF